MTSSVEKPSQVPQGKISGVTRATELRSEIGVLIKERARVKREVDELLAQSGQLQDAKALADENRKLKADNESLRATVAGIDPNDYARLQREEAERIEADKAAWQDFMQRCELTRQANPDFPECVRAVGDLPNSWIRTIAGLVNGPEFVLFLGRSPQFRGFLSQLKDSAAIQRIQHVAVELQQLGR
ncbi:MAG: hypothetical protein ACRD3P_00765 [Terriglobales bacterium]